MSRKHRKKIICAVVIVVLAVIVFMILDSGMKAIPDTNGADNYKLNTITDEQIIKGEMGAINPISIREDQIGDGLTFSSENFSGVYEVLYDNLLFSSDFVLYLSYVTVTEGNFRMVVIHDGEIVAEIEPNNEYPIVEYYLENVSGTVSLRIAGESASYSFRMNARDYDDHTHP